MVSSLVWEKMVLMAGVKVPQSDELRVKMQCIVSGITEVVKQSSGLLVTAV